MKGTILTSKSNNNMTIEENTNEAIKKANEIDMFIAVFKTWEDYIFADATYELNKQRQTNLRKPSSLPEESDIQTLREYVMINLKSTRFAISTIGPTLWNTLLSNSIKTDENLSTFQSATKQLIFNLHNEMSYF